MSGLIHLHPEKQVVVKHAVLSFEEPPAGQDGISFFLEADELRRPPARDPAGRPEKSDRFSKTSADD